MSFVITNMAYMTIISECTVLDIVSFEMVTYVPDRQLDRWVGTQETYNDYDQIRLGRGTACLLYRTYWGCCKHRRI